MIEGIPAHRHWATRCATTLQRYAGVELLLLGAVLLAAGCDAGFVRHAGATTVFALFGCGGLAFAAAGAWTRRAPVPQRPTALPAQAAVAGPLPAHPTSRALTLAPEAEPVAAPNPAPVPPTATATAPGCTFGPQVSHGTVPAATVGQPARPVAGAAANAGRAPEPAPDVVALMRLPLADLLLAAVCKDADGARRIFAQCIAPGAPGAVAETAARADPAVPQ